MSDLRERPELSQRRADAVREAPQVTVIEPRPPRGFRRLGWAAAIIGAIALVAGVAWMILRSGDEEPPVALEPSPIGVWDPSFGTYVPPGGLPYVPPVGLEAGLVGVWDPSFGAYVPASSGD